jgi:hypothetical protein
MRVPAKDLQELDFKKTHVIQLDEQAHPAFERLQGISAPKAPSVSDWLAEHGDDQDHLSPPGARSGCRSKCFARLSGQKTYFDQP